jgi:hypothetical protein
MRHDLYPPPSEMPPPSRLLLWHVLFRVLCFALTIGWLIVLLVVVSGCRMVPRQDGGAMGTTITPGGISTGTRLADSPEEASRQSVKRTVVETYAPTPHLGPRTAPAAPQEPLQTPPPVLTQRTTVDEVQTEVGASQDLAGIVKATQNHWRKVVSVLVGLGLLTGAWFAYRNEWPTPAACLAVGGLASIVTLNLWWGVAAVGVAGLVVLAFRAASARIP